MAESSPPPPSTSEEPSIEKPGVGLLIPDTSPPTPDPIISGVAILEMHPTENGVIDSAAEVILEIHSTENEEIDSAVEVTLEENEKKKEELRYDIEREIYGLTLKQAEIGAARNGLEAIDDVEERNDPETVEKDDLDEEKNGKAAGSVIENEVGVDGWDLQTGDINGEKNGSSESVEAENENEVGDENVGQQWGDGAAKTGRYNQSNNRSNYPMRPDAEDCAYYMKFGTCKFGLNCKFNHPTRRKNQVVKDKMKHREENPDKAGQTECKYYMTSGGCKYGKDCIYIHGSDNSFVSHTPELNFLGLPIRMGEKECSYYMRTGSCKYGLNCRFHHPEPTTVVGGDPGHGNGGSLPSQFVHSSNASSWSSPTAYAEPSPFPPVRFPPSQGAAKSPDWNGHQAAAYPISERGLPTPPAFAMKNLPTEINFPLPHLSMVVDEYPERPGEPECSFFMKTGECKYKSGCKFHHPKNDISKARAKASPFVLSDKGLPLRPGQPICSHYHQYGICKYGPACKYDHPSNVGVLPPPPFNQPPPFGYSKH